jgi:hypothetical protein
MPSLAHFANLCLPYGMGWRQSSAQKARDGSKNHIFNATFFIIQKKCPKKQEKGKKSRKPSPA